MSDEKPANPMQPLSGWRGRNCRAASTRRPPSRPHEGGFALTLDGKPARTPGKNPLVVASRAVAQALAAEWQAQGERIDPATMPLTRIVNSAIDRVAREMEPVRAEIVNYAGSDLICYRAEGAGVAGRCAGGGLGAGARLGARRRSAPASFWRKAS